MFRHVSVRHVAPSPTSLPEMRHHVAHVPHVSGPLSLAGEFNTDSDSDSGIFLQSLPVTVKPLAITLLQRKKKKKGRKKNISPAEI